MPGEADDIRGTSTPPPAAGTKLDYASAAAGWPRWWPDFARALTLLGYSAAAGSLAYLWGVGSYNWEQHRVGSGALFYAATQTHFYENLCYRGPRVALVVLFLLGWLFTCVRVARRKWHPAVLLAIPPSALIWDLSLVAMDYYFFDIFA